MPGWPWGVEDNAEYDITAASAALFYEAESRTPLGGAATAVGPAGASGTGSNVVRETALSPTLRAVLSTQASGGGAHLSHVGTFRVYARVQIPTTNTASVTVALEWTVGDFLRTTRNPSRTIFSQTSLAKDSQYYGEGVWFLLDLGLVTIPKVAQGTQRWEGRILVSSTFAGNDIDVDCLFLLPAFGGIAKAIQHFDTPSTFSARDEFDQTAGALAGKTAPVGGVWAGAGSGADFSVETTGKTAERTALSDGNPTIIGNGHFAVSGVAGFAAQVVQVDVKTSLLDTGNHLSVVARYTDTSNWLRANLQTNGTLYVSKAAAGAYVALREADTPPLATGTWYTIRLLVDAAGRWAVWFFPAGTAPGNPVLLGHDVALATGGALASGKPGFYDCREGTGAATRNYDNFLAFVPQANAAIFAGQSLEVRSDSVIREDSTGAIWQPVSSYEGDYLRVPVAGREDRKTRFTVIPSKHDPATMPHDFGAISARLTYVPRYLAVPKPS